MQQSLTMNTERDLRLHVLHTLLLYGTWSQQLCCVWFEAAIIVVSTRSQQLALESWISPNNNPLIAMRGICLDCYVHLSMVPGISLTPPGLGALVGLGACSRAKLTSELAPESKTLSRFKSGFLCTP